MKEKIAKMLEEAKTLPINERIRKIETAIIMCEDMGEWELAFEGRIEYIDATMFAGKIELAFDSFGWCLEQYYKHPETINPSQLLWQYKWIVHKVDSFLSLSLEEMDNILEGMKELYSAFNISLRPYYQKKHGILLRRGDIEAANEYFGRWMVEPRDDYADCIACEENERAYFYLKTGKYEDAMYVYEPILKGVLKCGEVPHLTYGRLIIPLYLKGEKEKAKRLHEKSYSLISNQLNYIGETAESLMYLSLADPKKGLKVLKRHLSLAEETNDLISKFKFYLAGWHLFHQLEEKSIAYDQQALGDKNKIWFIERTRELQNEFDKRNHTDYYQMQINELFSYGAKTKG